jgi:N-methylhydantoinase A
VARTRPSPTRSSRSGSSTRGTSSAAACSSTTSAVAALGRLGRELGLDLGLDAEATARRVWLAQEQMTLAVRALLVERGLDPRRFAFVCYGGCGPLFAVPIARALGIGRVVVPALAAVFSAFRRRDRGRAARSGPHALPAAAGRTRRPRRVLRGARSRDRRGAGRPAGARGRSAPGPDLGGDRTGRRDGRGDLDARSAPATPRSTAGARSRTAPASIVSCRLIATGAPPPAPGRRARSGRSRAGAARLRAPPGFGQDGRGAHGGLRRRARRAGHGPRGSALIERRDTTILLGAADRARVEPFGDLLVEVGHALAGHARVIHNHLQHVTRRCRPRS